MLYRKTSKVAKKNYAVLYLLTPKKRAPWDHGSRNSSRNHQSSSSSTQVEGLIRTRPFGVLSEISRREPGSVPSAPHSPQGHDVDWPGKTSPLPIRPTRRAESVTRIERLCREDKTEWSTASKTLAFVGSKRRTAECEDRQHAEQER
jgi:hypothetical protein